MQTQHWQIETSAKPGITEHAVIPAQAGILPEFKQYFVFQ
ncbi:D-alanine-D-alanine ligase [Neisseria bacilliformis ATCC BAA-1200]|uniref:D-alanine-D-alanine ligase n=1 Tax=Neisseria bacilliformis ATCC BAA-1200 TaxID=888742 RepID=F2BCA1_9NEIS|nr:D-alanine-D-alanine ligase [Neisseria bacilliformis ATCC BAA-1200]